jgi:ABC-type transport system involved in multi-copper enzyme maturation permease subunit
MNPPSNEFSAPGAMPNQWRAFGGVWRLTAWRCLSRNHLLVIAGMLVGLALFCSRLMAPSSAGDYLDWVAEFFLSVVVPVLAFLSGAGALRDEAKPGSADYVFTRPVRRWAFVGFKYLAHMACTQLTWLAAFGVVVLFAVLRRTPEVAAIYVWVLLAQMLTIAAFIAFGFVCAVLTSRYMIIGLLYAGIVEVGIGNIPAPLSRLSMTRHVRGLLQPVLDGSVAGVSVLDALATAGSMMLFSAVFVGVAALVFSRQELTGTRARD